MTRDRQPPGGGEAFPVGGITTYAGMSYRKWLVGQALRGTATADTDQIEARKRASAAVLIADRCVELLLMDKYELEAELKGLL